MAIYAIADLHLSHAEEKSMDIFGAHWAGHWQKIQAAWRARITEEDLVLIPGDISWAMHMPEAQPDLDAIGAMPGQKLILRGNHD
ncbi:MAG: metallophosphoesterase [Acutalibacteraceae bacterium]